MKKVILQSVLSVLFLAGCASSILQLDKGQEIQKNDEFDRAVRIESVGEEIGPPRSESQSSITTATTKDSVKPSATGPVVTTPAASKGKASAPPIVANAPSGVKAPPAVTAKTSATKAPLREPDIEDAEGFVGRRPLKDPFRVGEVVTHNVNYFKVSAGEIKLRVDNYSNVNGKKSYTFVTELKTSPLFETFYAVDDKAVTQVGFDDLVPSAFQLHVKESGQLREARSFFDWSKQRAFFWEKKITKKNGEEIKKIDWEILPFSQNVFSALFYMRAFQWKADKEYSFRVAHDNENLVFKAKVVRREVLETEAGTFKAIVVKPEITVKGLFRPVGDIFIWLSDDDRKYVLRIESKIKIGTLVSEVTKIEPGR